MKHYKLSLFVVVVAMLALGLAWPAQAQEPMPSEDPPALLLLTDYPSQLVGVGETTTLNLKIMAGQEAQLVDLRVEDLPADWTATFRGGNRVVQSVYALPDTEATVDLRLDIPSDTGPGTYEFTVIAQNGAHTSQLPVKLMVEEKVPANVAFEVDLPTIRARPNATFRFNTKLRNDGDEPLTVDLAADAPSSFLVTFKSSAQEVTSIPLEANSTKSISVEAESLLDNATPADSYPIQVTARGGDVEATTTLVAEVVGESNLSMSTPDDRLSGDIQAGEPSELTLVLTNSGSAPARNLTLSASPPSGWTVTFDPKEIAEVAPGQQTEVRATIQPDDKALAGDYMLTFRARPEDSTTETVEYRATVRTSTLWGIGGIALIAVAVGVVAVAVMRFGRR